MSKQIKLDRKMFLIDKKTVSHRTDRKIKSVEELSMFYAHTAENDRKQPLSEHLENTAEKARAFSVDALSAIAYICGLLHDIGKYSAEFQLRLGGANIRTEHSLGGAVKAIEMFPKGSEPVSYMLAYCIAGHHSGLPDGGSLGDSSEDKTLNGRLLRNYADFSAFSQEISFSIPETKAFIEMLMENSKRNGKLNQNDAIELFAFFTKYLFSCLTDADFLDTESFCRPDIDRKSSFSFNDAIANLDNELAHFKQDTHVRKARFALKNQALENLDNSSQIFVLNMPTGSGKTLCSLKLALELLQKGKKKRIIYVIPYTSIIEQTAEVFEKIFKDSIPVLQHFSSYSFEEGGDENELSADKLKRSSENWDAPFIITTNVQFFQSVYHYKASKLRSILGRPRRPKAIRVFPRIPFPTGMPKSMSRFIPEAAREEHDHGKRTQCNHKNRR